MGGGLRHTFTGTLNASDPIWRSCMNFYHVYTAPGNLRVQYSPVALLAATIMGTLSSYSAVLMR